LSWENLGFSSSFNKVILFRKMLQICQPLLKKKAIKVSHIIVDKYQTVKGKEKKKSFPPPS
jgi:hypothetical protein